MKITHVNPLSFYVSLRNRYSPNFYDPRDDIKKWCEENIEHKWYMRGVYISFRSPTDAMAFKLKWCS